MSRQRSRLRLEPDRSAVLVEVRSTAGPISFGTVGVRGTIEAAMTNGVLHPDVSPSGSIAFDVMDLHSGNRLYDAELLRRIDARRYLDGDGSSRRPVSAAGPGALYTLTGEVDVPTGCRRQVEGIGEHRGHLADPRSPVTGEQVFDIRDFSLSSPTVLMLRIYPDIRVRLHVEAELEVSV